MKIFFWVAVLSGPAAVGLWFLAALSPQTVETIYSRAVYPVFMSPWSRLTSSVPISMSLCLLTALPLAAVASFFVWPPLRALACIGAGLSLLAAWFVLGWGLNYQRLSWGDNHGWTVSGGTVAQLEALAKKLIGRTNELRLRVPPQQVWDSAAVRRAVTQAYQRAGTSDPLLAGTWGDPTVFPIPEVMSWVGLGGIFVPFTGEPFINGGPADWQLPFTMAHEAAHLRGWAREDEANFLAFWALHDDAEPALAYSAWSSALLYVAQALEGTELGAEAWKRLVANVSPEIRGDWNHSFAYWDRYKGPVRDAAGAINDVYLKSQGQSDGVRSYGRMVDLLLRALSVTP